MELGLLQCPTSFSGPLNRRVEASSAALRRCVAGLEIVLRASSRKRRSSTSRAACSLLARDAAAAAFRCSAALLVRDGAGVGRGGFVARGGGGGGASGSSSSASQAAATSRARRTSRPAHSPDVRWKRGWIRCASAAAAAAGPRPAAPRWPRRRRLVMQRAPWLCPRAPTGARPAVGGESAGGRGSMLALRTASGAVRVELRTPNPALGRQKQL